MCGSDEWDSVGERQLFVLRFAPFRGGEWRGSREGGAPRTAGSASGAARLLLSQRQRGRVSVAQDVKAGSVQECQRRAEAEEVRCLRQSQMQGQRQSQMQGQRQRLGDKESASERAMASDACARCERRGQHRLCLLYTSDAADDM
eukprot:410869-Rhodomonas_salina.2